MLKIQFLGAAGTVTGSKYLIESFGHRFMVDCGLFQGTKQLRRRNWEPLPTEEGVIPSLEALILTHAHLDHTGYLPRLCKDGFDAGVWCTHATKELTELVLRDSAHLQVEQADYVNRKGVTRHKPALPLYDLLDAENACRKLCGVEYREFFPVVKGVSGRFWDAGHILGSAWLELVWEELELRLVFSGDLGRTDAPILRDPVPLRKADFLVLESTYGDRLHEATDIQQQLTDILCKTIEQNGILVIPAFALERTQELLYLLNELQSNERIPDVPVFIDSPMAVKATRVFGKYPQYYDEEARHIYEMGQKILGYPKLFLCESVQQSKGIAEARPPFVVISASGMAVGGRILHHLRNYLPDKRNTVLLVGYQSVGTRGWRLQQGEKKLKIFGEWVPVRAKVTRLEGFSGHADYRQIEAWTSGISEPPRTCFMTHGDPPALQAQLERYTTKYGWNVKVPAYGDEVVLVP